MKPMLGAACCHNESSKQVKWLVVSLFREKMEDLKIFLPVC